MKISNSKKQLARIISENGGWRDGAEWAAQGGNRGHVGFASVAPVRNGKVWDMTLGFAGKFLADEVLPNWHQAILSRNEYFYLYPELDSSLVAMCEGVTEENKHPEYCESVMRSIQEPSYKPTIEQLAADYRAKLAIARQAQEEADSHRCGAEAALEKLHQAGLSIGLDIAIADSEQEGENRSELVITDWRDLQVGDIIECIGSWEREDTDGRQFAVTKLDPPHSTSLTPIRISVPGVSFPGTWGLDFKFIRRP